MKKKLFLLTALAGLIFSGCDCFDCKPQSSLFSVSTTSLTFADGVPQLSFTVISPAPWELTNLPAAAEYTFTPSSGLPGVTVVKVTMNDFARAKSSYNLFKVVNADGAEEEISISAMDQYEINFWEEVIKIYGKGDGKMPFGLAPAGYKRGWSNDFPAVVDGSGNVVVDAVNFPCSVLRDILQNGLTTYEIIFTVDLTPGNFSAGATANTPYAQPAISSGGVITATQVSALTKLIINNLAYNAIDDVWEDGTLNVTSLKGIELFPNIEVLQVTRNRNLRAFDAGKNPKLTQLFLSNTGLEEIDVSKCPNLQVFRAGNTFLKTVDLRENKELRYVITSEGPLQSVDVSGLTKLGYFNARTTPQLTNVNVTGCTALEILFLYDAPQVTSITGFSTLTGARELHLYNTGLYGSLDVSTFANLEGLWAYDTHITYINASNLAKFYVLRAYWTGAGSGPLQAVNISGCPTMGHTNGASGTMPSLPNNSSLHLYGQSISTLDISGTVFRHTYTTLRIQNNNMTSLTVPPTGAVATSTLAQWQSDANANNLNYRLTGNSFGTGNVGITQAP